MGTIRFYTDEHIPRALIRGLRARGVDVSTVADADLLGAADATQLEHARAQRRVVLTYDADFLRLHVAGVEHAGIVYGGRELSIGDVIRDPMIIVQVLSADDMINHVEFL